MYFEGQRRIRRNDLRKKRRSAIVCLLLTYTSGGGGGCLRLGVVLMGTGAHAAACAGALAELERRQIEPYAVCGMGAGAWPAALFLASYDGARMQAALAQAQRMGERMLDARSARSVLRGRQIALAGGARMQHLLCAQAGEKIMALCQRRGIIPLRTARTGRRVIFSTHIYNHEEGAMLTLQASLAFAARAGIALPPFLPPVEWMGSPLVPETDALFACAQLRAMGAHRVLVISPCASVRRELDALELAGAMHFGVLDARALPEYAALLRVPMPDDTGALSLGSLCACAQAGRRAAEGELDGIFERMGMAFCRVLPFRRSYV